jgi:hypothetical protein
MNRLRILLCGSMMLTVVPVWATPFDDLASVSSEVRTSAAKQIREQHLHPPVPRERWEMIFASVDINTDGALDAMISRLPANISFSRRQFPDQGSITIPLDPFWELVCELRHERLLKFEIRGRVVGVPAPDGYSGFWRIYRVDGTTGAVYDYQNGRNLGNTLYMQ